MSTKASLRYLSSLHVLCFELHFILLHLSCCVTTTFPSFTWLYLIIDHYHYLGSGGHRGQRASHHVLAEWSQAGLWHHRGLSGGAGRRPRRAEWKFGPRAGGTAIAGGWFGLFLFSRCGYICFLHAFAVRVLFSYSHTLSFPASLTPHKPTFLFYDPTGAHSRWFRSRDFLCVGRGPQPDAEPGEKRCLLFANFFPSFEMSEWNGKNLSFSSSFLRLIFISLTIYTSFCRWSRILSVWLVTWTRVAVWVKMAPTTAGPQAAPRLQTPLLRYGFIKFVVYSQRISGVCRTSCILHTPRSSDFLIVLLRSLWLLFCPYWRLFSFCDQIVAVLNNHHESLAWLDEKSRYIFLLFYCLPAVCLLIVCQHLIALNDYS